MIQPTCKATLTDMIYQLRQAARAFLSGPLIHPFTVGAFVNTLREHLLAGLGVISEPH